MHEKVINLGTIWRKKGNNNNKENIWYVVRNNTKYISDLTHVNERDAPKKR